MENNRDELKEINIKKLPIVIQKKIYIMIFRNFWRSYIPLTAKVPSWYNNKIKVEKI